MKIRLVGIRVGLLSERDKGQISIFKSSKTNEKQEKIDKAIDSLKEKYGYNSVTRAGKLNADNLLQGKISKTLE